MKPEPLKDKLKDGVSTELRVVPPMWEGLFLKEDILSAVEWLKKQLEARNTFETRFDTLLAIKLIDEAFDDVMEKKE